MQGDLATVSEVFTNATLALDPPHGLFGVCFVAYAGTHDRRYRGERLLEVAAEQLRAATVAAGKTVPQCVVTDQPERPRPYVDLVVPLRSSADGAPFLARCTEYAEKFKRPCKLYFGYMAKAVAALQAPYELTVFLDTDTFVCSGAMLAALPRLSSDFDVLLSMPRTAQGWVNSGVLVVRRAAVRQWAAAWLREFASLDDFGDQLHLLKVLPAVRGLRVGELPAEIHLRQGAVAEPTAVSKLSSVVHGPVLLLHSKGLASLTNFLPYFAARFGDGGQVGSSGGSGGGDGGRGSRAESGPSEHVAAARSQLVAALGSGQPEPRRKAEKWLYSPRTLAGFCLLLLDSGRPAEGRRVGRQWVLNTNGSCADCSWPPEMAGALGAVLHPRNKNYACTPRHGTCDIQPAMWPTGTEAGLPTWLQIKQNK